MANTDLKSLFTSEKQYTVLQLLNALINETEKAVIKTAEINQDVDKGVLTVTITLADDSVLSATTNLNSLTDEEKTLISVLKANIYGDTTGMSFKNPVVFNGSATFQSGEIHQGYESHLGDENHTGTETHKGIIKATEIDNLSGNAMLRDKDTEGAIVLGSSTKKAVIMGSGVRPTYSKDGSDFTGSELALVEETPQLGVDTTDTSEIDIREGTSVSTNIRINHFHAYQIGKLVFVHIGLTFASATTEDKTVRVALPSTLPSASSTCSLIFGSAGGNDGAFYGQYVSNTMYSTVPSGTGANLYECQFFYTIA